jgi:hypothetical protein
MSDWETMAAGHRAGSVSTADLSRWIVSLPVLWFVVEGEFAEDGTPLNVRPIVSHHPSGATVSLLFTSRAHAEQYRATCDETDRALGIVAASPSDGFEALLGLPIDGMTINAGSDSRLNAGRAQIEALARLAQPPSS